MAEAPAKRPFVHLRVHSAYSLLEGALPVPQLAELAGSHAMPALGIADRDNLFGALEFSETLAAAGIQPIIGCALRVDFADVTSAGGQTNGQNDGPVQVGANGGYLVFLAKNENGYANLLRLTSAAFLDHPDASDVHITLDELRENATDLVVLSGGPEGPADQAIAAGNKQLARARLALLKDLFGDRLYVELQRHGLEEERDVEPELINLAYDLELPIVATNQPYFASQDDFEAHDALICIAESTYISVDERRRLSPQHYFKSAEEMSELFADLPEAIENTVEIAQRCAYRPLLRDPILPQWVTDGSQDQKSAEAKELTAQAEEGLKRRLQEEGVAEGFEETAYWERLQLELEIISRMAYAGYFLIVADFIQWAKNADIPVGPGRGSGAGSLVAWALTITDLDPMRFGLLFERFLNPERVSMPDFDIDFCQDRRDEVIAYVQQKYGDDRVAQIITFGKLQARAVLRDVGRVLQMSYGHVDRLCKMVPADPANPVSLPAAIAGEPKLQEERDREPIVGRLLDIGQRLEGLYRHASTHAAGIVIGDRPLTELVPLYRDPRSNLPATQFNMKWVEAAGLVKFDFLGLKTLTVIEKTRELLSLKGENIDPARIPLDDKETFDLLSEAETVGVFQLESAGMREALRKLKPDRFEDIIAMVALYRPGPMDDIPRYIACKTGAEPVTYPHPSLETILSETYGVIVYQEQVMQIAQLLSGYSLGEADLLRRAMGKKIKKEMDEQRSRFVDGAVENEVDKGTAEYIFELIAKFAGYGFNKCHSGPYALIAYQTAYLKANYPVEFLAASMTLDMGNTDKLNVFVQDARRAKIPVEPPCVNASKADFSTQEQSIRYALGALKNMGRAAAETIVAERDENGAFKTLADFAHRLNARAVNKRGLEALIAAGALDSFDPDRGKLFGNCDRLLRSAANPEHDDQNDLFGEETARDLILRDAEPWLPLDKLTREQEAIGFFVSGHPLDQYEAILQENGIASWADFSARAGAGAAAARVAGVISYRQERTSARGNRFAFIGLSDQTGQFEAIVFSELLSSHTDILVPGAPVLVDIEAEADADALRARITGVESLEALASRTQGGMRIVVDDPTSLAQVQERLQTEGEGRVWLVLQLPDAGRELEFEIPGRFDVSPNGTGALSVIPGVRAIEPVLNGGARTRGYGRRKDVLSLANA
ncbi:MAG: DNA polymerase III subunit alpha [Hyphomicrobiaceae bacterium]|nr:DNA polymerase III subunit alpha [Hyphomicrobiaceae bacterium]